MMDGYNELIGKKVFLILKSNRQYTGKVIDVKGDMISIKDKFNELVIFNASEISSLEVEK